MSIEVHDGLLQVFDVEHGACALVTLPNGRGGFSRMLIDCGHNTTTKFYPGAHLKRLNVSQLELLVVTNYDEDHVSGYPNLLQNGVNVDWILRNPTVSPETIQQLKTEDGMGNGIATLVSNLPRYNVTASQAQPPTFQNLGYEWFFNQYPYFNDENNLSLVLHLDFGGFKFLFPGDMECNGFNHILDRSTRFREVVSGVDVLIASHHGRRNGICPDMFDVWGCAPKLVIISDDYKQYDTQETVGYYANKASGIVGFRGQGSRKVLTTRSEKELRFSLVAGNCIVS